MAEHSKDNKTRIISNVLYFAEVQRMLDDGKEVRIRIKGGSMRPFIHDGDSVILQTYYGEPLQLGSNVLAKHEGKYVFHRYVGKRTHRSCWQAMEISSYRNI
ncbi:S24/S26 family peptidase [Sphingobacterium sp. E70]|uniref:S24/S26 family peptidase n=1 Tax=Sphingobacterium sp. E70 TaxID=2853439 RepID=UPI00211CC39F|nr:S24/S26 family peptidase [Sphingobacterium sp. E70]ULT28290.1 S24/S26 family peptidase [Sphingobacterium sp. E70]